ncbi:hypothetical protein B7463_g3664, partial [Scytalidium lignicola]
MSPPVAVSGSAKDFKKESTVARLLGSGSAGIAELAVFHPVDTIAKRLMSNQGRIASVSQLNQVIFKDKAAAPAGTKFFSLFPGLGYAAGYKVLQRVYKYGGQPFVRDYLAKNYGTEFDQTFGAKTGKAMMHSFAGSLIGIGEIVLLPLDVLKIKRQTNPEAFRGRGVFRIVKDEGFGLYRGWGWTAARNAPGSFALFGGSAFTKGYLYGLSDYNKATWTQNFVASIAGASASLIVSAPLDVIKTRIQNRNFENPESGFRIVGSMMKNEGITSFFKGLVPKLLMTGPKGDICRVMGAPLAPLRAEPLHVPSFVSSKALKQIRDSITQSPHIHPLYTTQQDQSTQVTKMPAPKYLISKIGDPIFALFIGLSAAGTRVNREEKELGHTTKETIDAGFRRLGFPRANDPLAHKL